MLMKPYGQNRINETLSCNLHLNPRRWVPLWASFYREGSWGLVRLSNLPKVTQRISQEAGPRVQALTVLSHSRSIALKLSMGVLRFFCAGGFLPKQLPTVWAPGAHHAPPSSLHHPTAMWANTLPLPRQGMPNLHNLIKFCILVFGGAGLWRMLSAWS